MCSWKIPLCSLVTHYSCALSPAALQCILPRVRLHLAIDRGCWSNWVMVLTASQGQEEPHSREYSAVNPQHRKQAPGQRVWRQAGRQAAVPALLPQTHTERGGENVLWKSSDRGCLKEWKRVEVASWKANRRGLQKGKLWRSVLYKRQRERQRNA